MIRIAARIFLGIALLIGCAGCDEVFQNKASRSVEHAEDKEKAGDYQAAIELYEASLDGTPKCADVHYRLAMIYDEKLGNPLSASHHFQRYLELSPHGTHAKDAHASIKQDEQKIIAALSKGALMTQNDAAILKNENLRLNQQLMELRARPAAVAVGASPARRPIPAGARTYIVEPHDTLASISRKYFKTSAHWKAIQDANFQTLGGTVKLKPGMKLIIPDR